MWKMRFSDKNVVITGGARGIGRRLVECFIAEGARVAVIDLEAEPIECDFYFQGDLGAKENLEAFSRALIKRYGKMDCLIHNGATTRKGILSGCNYEDFLYVQKVNLLAPYYLTDLLKENLTVGGSIVNISSSRWNMSQPDTESYSAAKGGITALTHSLAISLAGQVRVNSIAPGWIDTAEGEWSEADQRQHPVGRIGVPRDIANLVMFLCSEESSFITGQNFTVDGGMSKLMIYHGENGWNYNPEEG